MGLEQAREAFADALMAVCPGKPEAVRRAFATVPREAFLGRPPWHLGHGTELTPLGEATDVEALYQDVTVAIDPVRHLNNGSPSLWAAVFDSLHLQPGERVLQVGAGTGYYSAVLAEVVGKDGSVEAMEVDRELADRARVNLEPWPNVVLITGDGSLHAREPADAIILFAGATHVVAPWLDGLLDGGRLYVPLTINLHDPVEGLGFGMALRVERRGEDFAARFSNPIGVYPCTSARTAEANSALHGAFQSREALGNVRSLRRERHSPDETCWYHVDGACLSTREGIGK